MKYIVRSGKEQKEFDYTLRGVQDAFDHAVLASSGNGIATVAKGADDSCREEVFAKFANGERIDEPACYFPAKEKKGKKK